MESRGLIPFLVAMMLLTGVCNTLLTKYQVRTPAASHSSSPPLSSMLLPSIAYASD